jgi:hypothetical protein
LFSPSAANSTAAPTLRLRAGIDTTWGAWSTILHQSNFNSFAPSLTGGNASGTWGISITGTAANATAISGITSQLSLAVQGGTISSLLGQDTNGSLYRYNNAALQAFMSGTYGISVTGNAGTVGGYAANTSVVGSTIPVRDVNGYLFNTYFNGTDEGTAGTAGTVTGILAKRGDNYYRTTNAASIATFLSSQDLTATNFKTSGAGRSIYGPNSTWGAYLYVGGDGVNGFTRTATTASVVATNGNLHMDAGTTNAMYLNYYSGTAGITFGNGASGVAGSISAAGVMTATSFSGSGSGLTGTAASLSIGGNAATATSATSATTSTYTSLTTQYGGNSNWDTGFSNTPAGNRDWSENSAGGPTGTWWFTENLRHTNGSGVWGRQLAWGWEDNAHEFYSRNVSNGVWSGWVRFLSSNNYNSFAPTLTGGNASGTWGISITGNAATVTSAPNRADPTAYPVVWNTSGGTSQNYSCAAVTIQSSTGTLNASAVYATGEITAFSDARVKTNIELIPNALSKVEAIRGVTYTRTDAPHEGVRQAGVIAQEVELVLPEVVKTNEDGMKSVAYGNLTALLIEAVKELSAQNKALLARLEVLEGK